MAALINVKQTVSLLPVDYLKVRALQKLYDQMALTTDLLYFFVQVTVKGNYALAN